MLVTNARNILHYFYVSLYSIVDMKIHTYVIVTAEEKVITDANKEKYITLNFSDNNLKVSITDSTAYRLYKDLKKSLKLK